MKQAAATEVNGRRGLEEKQKESKKERNGTDRLLLVYLTQWEIESRRVLASCQGVRA